MVFRLPRLTWTFSSPLQPIWIEMSTENAARMVAALEQFGFGSLGLTAADFLVQEQVLQLGQPPHRIDLLVKLSG